MEITFPEELYENLNDQLDEVGDFVSIEKGFLSEKDKTEIKKNQIDEKRKIPKAVLTFAEKKRLGLISDSLFEGGKKKLEEVKKTNDFRNKMRDFNILGASEKIKEKTEEIQHPSIDSFKKAIKMLIGAAGIFAMWKFGFLEKVNFKGLFDNFIFICKSIGRNINVLFTELPKRIKRFSSIIQKGLQKEDIKDKIVQKAEESLQTHIVDLFEKLFPHFMAELNEWFEVAGVIGNIIGMAMLGGQVGAAIGSIFGVAAVPGAIVGAAIGAVIGVIQSAIEYFNKDNEKAEKAIHEILKIQSNRAAKEDMMQNIRIRLYNLLKSQDKKSPQSHRKDDNSFTIEYTHDGLTEEEKEEVSSLIRQYNAIADTLKDDSLFWNLGSGALKDIDDALLFRYFQTLGLDTSLFNYGESHQKKYITGYNGVYYSAENKEPFFNEIRSQIESIVAARLTGTVLEGKGMDEIYKEVNDFLIQKPKQESHTEESEAIKTLLQTLDKSFVVNGKVTEEGLKALSDVSRALGMFHMDSHAKDLDSYIRDANNLGVFEREQKEAIEKNKREHFLKSYKSVMDDSNIEKVLSDSPLNKIIGNLFENFFSNDSFLSALFSSMGKTFGKSISSFMTLIKQPVKENASFVVNKHKMKNIITFFVSNKEYGRDVMSILLITFSRANGIIDNFLLFFLELDKKIQKSIEEIGKYLFDSKNSNPLIINEDFTIKTQEVSTNNPFMVDDFREKFFVPLDTNILISQKGKEMIQEIGKTFSIDESSSKKAESLERESTSTRSIELKDKKAADNISNIDSSDREISSFVVTKLDELNYNEPVSQRRLNPVFVQTRNRTVSVVSNNTSKFLSEYLTTQDALESNNGEGGYGIGEIIYS